MLYQREAPSSVLFADLRSYGGITNKDAARILLSGNVGAGGKAPRDRIESRTYLSREIVHVAPKDVNPSLYADFYGSVQTLSARVASRVGGNNPYEDMVRHYSGEAAERMCRALASYGIDDQLYRNECARLTQVMLRSNNTRHLLLFMLFCVTGCLADVQRAITLVEDFARRQLATDLVTIAVDANSASAMLADAQARAFGLLKIVGNSAQPPILPLNPQGTMVGTLATGMGAITNVAPDVSRKHANIWHENGKWYVQGLNSTYGTTLISAVTNNVITVEPPASERSRGQVFPPQEIQENDILCFASITRFRVLRVHTEI